MEKGDNKVTQLQFLKERLVGLAANLAEYRQINDILLKTVQSILGSIPHPQLMNSTKRKDTKSYFETEEYCNTENFEDNEILMNVVKSREFAKSLECIENSKKAEVFEMDKEFKKILADLKKLRTKKITEYSRVIGRRAFIKIFDEPFDEEGLKKLDKFYDGAIANKRAYLDAFEGFAKCDFVRADRGTMEIAKKHVPEIARILAPKLYTEGPYIKSVFPAVGPIDTVAKSIGPVSAAAAVDPLDDAVPALVPAVAAPVGPVDAAPVGPVDAAPVDPVDAAPVGHIDAAPVGPAGALPNGHPFPNVPVNALPNGHAFPNVPVNALPNGHAFPNVPVNAVPNGHAAPAGPVDAAPAGPVDAAPAGPVDAAPAGPVDAAPVGPVDAAPAGPVDVAPAGPVNAAFVGLADAADLAVGLLDTVFNIFKTINLF